VLIAAAVASFAALGYEALLVRFFSLSQWNHLTFLVLGVALLGFSASGVVLQVGGRLSDAGDPGRAVRPDDRYGLELRGCADPADRGRGRLVRRPRV
jgi:hypothetical protein